MRFYDRAEELQELQEMMRQSFEDHSRLTVLTGRRRIGKTSLGLKAMEGTPMVYLFVSRKNEALLAQEYAQLAAIELDEYIPDNITRFSDIFRMLMEIGRRKKFNPALLEEKVKEMQKHLFKHQTIHTDCLTLDEMV